jgi:basic amino acid/polyamine antiporter, APA family
MYLLDNRRQLSMTEQANVSKKRDIKLGSLVLSGLGGTIGGTIYVILGQTIFTAGAGILISIALLGVLIIFLVQNYAELSLSLPMLGGGYSFSREAIGGFWGYIIGWLLLFGNMAFAALSGLGFGLSLSVFFPNLNLGDTYLSIIGFCVILILSVLNLIAYSKLQKVMRVFTTILIFGFLIYIVLGLSLGPIFNTANFNPPNLWGDLSLWKDENFKHIINVSPVLFGIFCLYEWNSSFESITSNIDQIKQPSKKIPRAFLLSISIGIIIYFLVSLTTLLNIGADRSEGSLWNTITLSNSPLAETLGTVIGPIGLYIIGIAGMTSTMTSAQSAIQLSHRITYAMARDGYLPDIFAHNVSKTGAKVPRITMITSSLIILAITLFFGQRNLFVLVDFSNFSIILTMSLISFSVIILRRKRPNLNRQYKTLFYPVVPIVTGLVCLVLVFFIAPNGLAIGILMTLFGVVIYGFKLAKRERILLLLSGTKLGAVILTMIAIIFTKNEFTVQAGIFKNFIESLDGILILIICGISIITIIFDIKPLDSIIRQRIQKKDRDARVVSGIVEIGREKQKVAYRFNLILASVVLLMAAVMFFYSILIGYGIITVEDKFFATPNMNEITLVIFALFGFILTINGIKLIYLEMESRKIKI